MTPDGYFIKDMVVLGDPSTYVSKGAFVFSPDLHNSSDETLIKWKDQLRNILRSIGTRSRMQIHFTKNHNFLGELNNYALDTEKNDHNPYSSYYRDAIYREYMEDLQNRNLTKYVCRLYLCKQIDSPRPFGLSAKKLISYLDGVLDEYNREFLQTFGIMNQIFGSSGGKLIAMMDLDHFDDYTEFLNPSFSERERFEHRKHFDPMLSIHQQCLRSGIQGGNKNKPPFGFYQDSYYHNMLILKRTPKATVPGIIHKITSLDLIDYRITMNVYPLDADSEKISHQSTIDKLKKAHASTGAEELDTSIGIKKTKVRKLLGGYQPYHFDYVFRAWERTPAELAGTTEKIRQAIHHMRDA
ncbi:MAG: hypothetical protein V4507_10855, partial [Verrucomicrobiota bacterium]